MKAWKCTILPLALALLAGGCSEKKPAQPVAAQVGKKAESFDQEAWNSTAIATHEGKLTAKVRYAHMVRYSDRDLMKFDGGIEVFLYDKKGRVTSTVRAEQGILNEKQNLVEAFGHVVAHSDSENATLYTDHLTFDRRREKLFTDAPVTLTTAHDTLHGVGFESDQGLHHWVIRKPSGVSSRPVDLNVEKHFEAKRSRSDSLHNSGSEK
jgi:LPS export ABC transporter protein LptC